MTDQQLFQKFHFWGKQALQARNKCIGLLPEIFKRQIYLQKGFSSIYEFAAKLAGISREQVDRVVSLERRFSDKPVLHRALITGKIGLNKLRKVVSIATPENQEEIVETIKSLSVRAVEQLIRDQKNANPTKANSPQLFENPGT